MNKRSVKMGGGGPRVTFSNEAVKERELRAIVDTARAMAKPQRGQRKQNRKKKNSDNRLNNSRVSSNNGVGSLGVPSSVAYSSQGKQGEFPFAMDEIITIVKKQAGNHFDLLSFPINPGLPEIFQLASVPGQMYDLWGVDKSRGEFMEFYWVPLVTEFKVGQGNVIFTADYDAIDAAPESAEVMLKTDPRSEAMPHLIQVLRLDPAALMKGGDGKSKFVRSAFVGGSDLKTYDGGVVYVGIDGLPDDIAEGTALGEIRVRYKLHYAKLNPERIQGIEEKSPRNESYVNITQAVTNESFPLPDTGGTNWSDLPVFDIYWDYDVGAESTIGGGGSVVDPFRPGDYPQAAFPGIVTTHSDIVLPPGRYLFAMNYLVVANDPDPNPGNINVFRIRVRKAGTDLTTYPQWEDTMLATHHDSGAATANVYTVLGSNGSFIQGMPGGHYSLEYQQVTRAEEGSTFYYNITIVRLQ